MKYILNNYHYSVSDKELLDDLKRTAKKFRKRSISFNEYDASGKFSSSTLADRFGGWNRTLERAGLKINKLHAIPEAALFDNMKLVWDKLKRQPVQKDMVRPLSLHAASTYINKFGSWRSALADFVEYVKGRHKTKIKTGGKMKSRFREQSKPPPRQTLAGKRKITKSLRFEIMRRDYFKCRLCGASPALNPKIILHVDHIKPLAKGGKTTRENLQTLCSECNYGKGAKEVKPGKKNLKSKQFRK